MESTREIAERIALDAYDNRLIKQVNAFVREDYIRLVDTIATVLEAERERAAKIAESKYADSGYHGFFHIASAEIAAAIRGEE